MATVENNKQLTEIATRAFKRHGYDEAVAEFTAFRDFKLKWTRSYKWISLEVSDYMMGTEESVLENFFETVALRIRGEPTEYSDDVVEVIGAYRDDEERRDLFVRRQHFKVDNRLNMYLDSLIEEGLVPSGTGFRVYRSDNRRTAGSSIFNVGAVGWDDSADGRREVYKAYLDCTVPFPVPQEEKRKRVEEMLSRYDQARASI